MASAFGVVAAAGFVALVSLPILFAASALVRGLWAGWQLDIDDGPRVAGWLAYIWLALLALAWVMFQGTWLLAGATAFKPSGMAFAEPVLAVAAAAVLIAISKPTARGLTWLYRKLDPRVRVTPVRVIASL